MPEMTAAILDAYGDPLRIGSTPMPELRPATCVAAHARAELPAILGIDLAGTVEAIAHDVTNFAVGDAVYRMTGGASYFAVHWVVKPVLTSQKRNQCPTGEQKLSGSLCTSGAPSTAAR